MTVEEQVWKGTPHAGYPSVSLLSRPRRFDARQRAQKAPRAYSATPIAPQKAAKNAKTPHQTTGLGSGFGSPKPSSTSADRSHSVRLSGLASDRSYAQFIASPNRPPIMAHTEADEGYVALQ